MADFSRFMACLEAMVWTILWASLMPKIGLEDQGYHCLKLNDILGDN